MAEKKVLNIYQKINAVMQEVEYLSKDDHVKFGTTNYKAISEEKVTTAVRGSLVKNGLVLYPAEQEHLKEGNLSTVNVKYNLVNMDNPEESITIASSGTGVDTQDKGVGKAMTYAFKYALLRTFAIPTGEDPDKISSEEWDEKLKGKKDESSKEKAPAPVSEATITEAQQKRMFAVAMGNTELVKDVLRRHNYYKSSDVKKGEYNQICDEIAAALK